MADRSASISAVAADQPPLAGNEGLRRTLGGWLVAAVPHFYSLMPIAPSTLHQIVGDSIGSAGSEFENALMAGDGSEPRGVATWIALPRLRTAQQMSTIMLMRHVDRGDLATFRAAVAEYGKGVEPIDAEGVYCPRITVAPEARGKGIGRALLERIRLDAGDQDVWLHVASDNVRAIAVYRTLGFEFGSDGDYASRAMKWPRRPADT